MLRLSGSFFLGVIVTLGIVLAATSWLAPHRCLPIVAQETSIRRVLTALQSGWVIDGMYGNESFICLHQPLLRLGVGDVAGP